MARAEARTAPTRVATVRTERSQSRLPHFHAPRLSLIGLNRWKVALALLVASSLGDACNVNSRVGQVTEGSKTAAWNALEGPRNFIDHWTYAPRKAVSDFIDPGSDSRARSR